MRVSINEDYFRCRPGKRRTQLESLKLVREAGYDTVDFGMFSMKKAKDEGDDHLSWIKGRREYCDSIGLKVNQAHAPFYEGRPMPEGYQTRLLQCVEDCSILGANCLVVHADTWYEKDYEQWDYETVLKTVYEVYAPAVELAAKLGVKIAMETLFEYLGNDSHRTRLCSCVEELNDVLGKFDCDTVGVCWDFGHAAMTYREGQFETMKRLKYPIIATHVHDNIFKYDNHNLPFQGSINWEEGMRTLAELNYGGDITLEVGYGALPEDLVIDFIRYAHKTGTHLANIFRTYQKETGQ